MTTYDVALNFLFGLLINEKTKMLSKLESIFIIENQEFLSSFLLKILNYFLSKDPCQWIQFL